MSETKGDKPEVKKWNPLSTVEKPKTKAEKKQRFDKWTPLSALESPGKASNGAALPVRGSGDCADFKKNTAVKK